MLESVLSILAAIRVFVRSRSDASLAARTIRQQVAVLNREQLRSHLSWLDILFWNILPQLRSRWTGPKPSRNPAGSRATAPAVRKLRLRVRVEQGLVVELPESRPRDHALVLKIGGLG